MKMVLMLNSFKAIENVASKAAPGPNLTFMEVHVLKAIELIEKMGQIGRVGLSKELNLGEGATRTLIKHLVNEKIVKVSILGCGLTDYGKKISADIKSKFLGEINVPKNPITVSANNIAVLISGANKAVKMGLEQRDAAIKVGALGATTLIFSNNELTMPGTGENCFKSLSQIKDGLISGLNPKENDVIIIGSGDDPWKAELGAKAAMLETLKKVK
ncbi:MAG: DUF4443 domain-containing protein [Candidatus Bathyarchaeota archaeon]